MPKARIVIAYRDEGKGKGPFYDHYAFQRATGSETAISVPEEMTTVSLLTHVRTTTHTLKFGLPNDAALGRKVPETTDLSGTSDGLLVIPGRSRAIETKRPIVVV